MCGRTDRSKAARRSRHLSAESHPDTVPGFANAPLQQIANGQFVPNLSEVNRLVLVYETRIARDHEKPFGTCKAGYDLINDSVSKILLLWIAAHVLERQDSIEGFSGNVSGNANSPLSGHSLCRNRGPLCFPYASDKAEALARHCLYQSLLVTIVADRYTSRIYRRCHGRIRDNNPAIPDGRDEIVLAYDALTMVNKVYE